MKVSVNNCRAKSTEKHNDRSMYDSKWKHEFEKNGHKKNIHWDCMKCGSSFEAEQRFYEQKFRGVLDAQNERARKNYKPELTMDEWHQRHMPQEMIIQLGSLDEPPGDDNYILEVGKMAVRILRAAGVSPISLDGHFDEGTPHLHLRYVGIDSNGAVNLSGCLREHGVLTPLELACKAMEIEYNPDDAASVRQLQAARPDLFTSSGKLKVKSNTALNTLTNDIMRSQAEKLAEDMGYQIDTVRTKRRHLDVSAYKTERDRQRLNDMLDGLQERKDTLTADVQAQQAKYDELEDMTHDFLGHKKNAKIKVIAEREKAVAEREQAVESLRAQQEQEHKDAMEQVAKREKTLDVHKRALDDREGALNVREDKLDDEVKKRANELARPSIERANNMAVELAKYIGKAKTHERVARINATFDGPNYHSDDDKSLDL